MRVLSVATNDCGGGAEQIAWQLFDGLRQRGHESWLGVGDRMGTDPDVFALHSSPWFDYSAEPHRHHVIASEQEAASRREQGLEDFSHPHSRALLDLAPSRPDVVVCHNLHGGYFDLRALPEISQQVPVILVMHDAWLMTGHCAYPFDCGKWREGCGKCPDLSIPPAIQRDATRENLEAKRAIFRGSRYVVCSPGSSLLESARSSVLAEGATMFRTIPNGVDLENFRPGDKREARRRLGWSEEGNIVLVVGKGFEKSPFKDYPTLRATVERLAKSEACLQVMVLGGENGFREGKVEVIPLPGTEDPSLIADHYRAADLLFHPTRQEVSPLVLREAMASGIPVVASRAGSSAEIIGDAGFIAEVGDVSAHAEVLSRLLEDADLRREMGERGRLRVEGEGGLDRMIADYETLLLDLVGKPSRILSMEPKTRDAEDLILTVIYPCTDVRGNVLEHIESWRSGQTLDSANYELIVAIGPRAQGEEFPSIRPDERIRLVRADQESDVALWNAGAAAAKTPWLLFVEGHSPGLPGCLEAVDRWIRSEPTAAAGNVKIGHPDGYLMAGLSEKWFAEQSARWEATWPRFHRAGFAIRKTVFEEIGGFEPFGQFAVPLLGSRFHDRGYRLSAIPDAEVVHIDDETLGDHHFDTLDYVEGQHRARATEPAAFFERYFGDDPDSRNVLSFDRAVARGALMAVVRRLFRSPGSARRFLPAVRRSIPLALFRLEDRIDLSEVFTNIEELILLRVPLPWNWRYRWFVAAHRRAARTRSLRCALADLANGTASPLRPGDHSIDELGPGQISGLHSREEREGRPFRWSGPLLQFRVDPFAMIGSIEILTGDLRVNLEPESILAYAGYTEIPPEMIRIGPTSVVIPVPMKAASTASWITLLIERLDTSSREEVDPRFLGLPVFGITARVC